MDTYIGFDLGGTKLLIGEIDGQGNILRSKKYDTGYSSQRETTEKIRSCTQDYLTAVGFAGTPLAAGMGLIGKIDHEKGIWCSIGPFGGDNIPLGSLLESLLGVPVALDNDVRTALTAERYLGHGRQTQDFIYVNLGTGLAAGIVTGGHIIRGAHNFAGEVGHAVVDKNSNVICGCGRAGCCENLVSGFGFNRRVRELYARYPETALKLPESTPVDSRTIFALAQEGDPLCARVCSDGIETLAALLVNLVRVSDPDTILLGGGIACDTWFVACLQAELAKYKIMAGVTGGVIPSLFGPDKVGLMGAAALAMVKAGKLQ